MDEIYQKILRKYDHQVPRYTSYPAATRFEASPVGFSYTSWLEGAVGDLSLYIHIPFCARLCYYCGCNMRVVHQYDPVIAYLSTLKTEIAKVAAHINSSCLVTHIHFGGGSPTMLRPTDFKDLVNFIRDHFQISHEAEISLEADPRNMSEARIAAFSDAGVNRISLGVQDFNDDVLESINRPQPFHRTHQAVKICRDYGLTGINFDLMYGLPRQTLDKIQKTMELAILLNPTRISYFGYAHVPWMKRHMNLLENEHLPNPLQRYELQDLGNKLLLRSGYHPIGIDHYVTGDDSMMKAYNNKTLHRNFQGYTTDHAKTLIGLGASSIGEYGQGYHQNSSDIKTYAQTLEKDIYPTSKVLFFHEKDRPVKKLIETLMCYLNVDLKEICGEFILLPNYFDFAFQRLEEMESDGMIFMDDGKVTINPDYRVLTRIVCEVFDAYTFADQSLQRHARAV